MKQVGKLRAYGQNCPVVEIFPGPIITRKNPPWNLGTITLGQMLIQLLPQYKAKVFVYCGNDDYSQPIWVELGQSVPKPANIIVPPDAKVSSTKAASVPATPPAPEKTEKSSDKTENTAKEKTDTKPQTPDEKK